MSSNPAPPPFQIPNPNYPNHNPHVFSNPLQYPQSDASFRPPPPPSAGVDPNPQFSFTGPPSIAAQSYAQTTQEQEAYYSYLAAYAANQVNQQLYAAGSSTYGAVQPGSGNVTVELEIKKMKVLQGGAPADSVRTCEICNVVCNSDKVFASHLAGEKHKLKVLGRPSNYVSNPHVKAMHFIKKAKKAAGAAVGINFVQSSFCDVCKINCNSQDAFNTHKMGKKHLTNLRKLQESINPNLVKTNPTVTEPKVATKVDLEVKKKKVLSQGAAASAVKVCTYCNVVCNSQEVYNSHIVGKKHIGIVNKLQQSAPSV